MRCCLRLLFSTEDAHPRDRLAFWRDVACRTFVELDFCTDRGADFAANIRGSSLGELELTLVETDPGRVVRSKSDIARSASDDLLVSVQLFGETIVHQGDRQAKLTPGMFALYDTQKAYSLDVGTRNKQLVIKVPRSAFARRLGEPCGFTALGVGADRSLGALAADFMRMLPDRVDGIDQAASHQISGQTLDLIALALARVSGRDEPRRSEAKEVSLSLLKAVIAARIQDPSFGPGAAAAESGMSIRNANYLLASEGTSLEKYIVAQRLERARAVLEDPVQRHRSIVQIAYTHGFANGSHFSRKFKERFGLTPTQCRESGLLS